MTVISTMLKDTHNAGWCFPSCLYLIHQFDFCNTLKDPREIGDYQKLKQVRSLIFAAVADVILLLE